MCVCVLVCVFACVRVRVYHGRTFQGHRPYVYLLQLNLEIFHILHTQLIVFLSPFIVPKLDLQTDQDKRRFAHGI